MSLVVAECKCLPRILCVGFNSAELNALTRVASGAFTLLAAPAGHPVSAALERGAYAAVVCRMPVGGAALGLGKWSLTPVVNAPHPFDPFALAGELAAELDRPGHEPRQRGRLVLEPAASDVSCGDNRIHLTENQFDLLWRLAYRPGHICPRGRLARAIGGDDPFGRSLDMHISRLRTQLLALGLPRGAIRSVRGRGYQLREEAIV